MNKKRNLWVMVLFGILTFGIYNLVVVLRLLKSYYSLEGSGKVGYSARMSLWSFYYLTYMGSIMFMVLTVRDGQAGLLTFIAACLIMFVMLSGIMLLVGEFETITGVSNKVGLRTSEAYRYIIPCLAYGNITIVSLVMQSRMNTLIDLENAGKIKLTVTEV